MLEPLIKLFQQGGMVAVPLGILTVLLWYGLGLRLATSLEASRALHRRASDEKLRGARADLSVGASLVATCVLVAPLLGLLGTVNGMIETFDSLGTMSLYRRSGGVAGGISEALISTQMGLVVAIPGAILGRLMARRAERLDELLGKQLQEET